MVSVETARITLRNVGSIILERIPELRKSWEEEGLGPPDEFSTILMENSLNPYIKSYSSLDAGQHARLAALLEELLTTADEIVKDIVEKLILPTFCEHQDVMNEYWRFLGAETRKRMFRVNIELGLKTRLPGEGGCESDERMNAS